MMPFISIMGFLACFGMALYFLIKKENGDLVGGEELFNLSGKSSFIKSIITHNVYYVCLYYRTSGNVVRRLELLKKRKRLSFFKSLKNKLNSYYYGALFSSFEGREASYCNLSNQVIVSFSNGKVLKINISKLL